MTRLEHLDLTPALARKEYLDRLLRAQRRWLQLRLHLGGEMGTGENGPGVMVIFEGLDAAGKGGAIKRLVEPLDPRHYRVTSYARPTPDEKRHPFLWRFFRQVPGLGGMTVLDRSWYGRVLVERVESFATPEEWGRAFEEIVDFEQMLASEGVIVIKFWMHISDDEQLPASATGSRIRCGAGRSPTRTGATVTRRTPTSSPPRRCSSAPITTSPRGTSCPASRSATRRRRAGDDDPPGGGGHAPLGRPVPSPDEISD